MKDDKPDDGRKPAGIDPFDDDLDDAIIAADDTGMLGGERLITNAEVTQTRPNER